MGGISCESFGTLRWPKWLVGDVVNAFLNLLPQDDIHVFNSQFLKMLMNEGHLDPDARVFDYENVERWALCLTGTCMS